MSDRLFKFHMDDAASFLQSLSETSFQIILDAEKHGFSVVDNGKALFSFRFPLLWPVPLTESLSYYLEDLPDTFSDTWNLLLMEAGRAALASVNNNLIVAHKNIRKYMVRKKQGKAQLTHLNSKGKSRYGSRLRLQETEEFFEEILDRLYSEPYVKTPLIFYNCPVRLKACLAEAAQERESQLDDFRWTKLGVSIKESSFDELQRLILEPYYCRLTIYDDGILESLPPIPAYKK
jgi:hypothetical protein